MPVTDLTPATVTRDYSRLTRSDIGCLLKLHRDGLTQVQIAQRLGCSQNTVSNWVEQFSDTTEPAKVYLKGQSLRMAQHLVKKGRASDHVKALEGLGVLQSTESTGLTLILNGLTLHGTGREGAVEVESVSVPVLEGVESTDPQNP